MTDEYVVAVKPSARKRSRAVGEWVNREGPWRTFPTRALAREWARACSRPDAPVWLQDAPPWDDGPADGYLVGGRRAQSTASAGTRQRPLDEAVDGVRPD
ncbi:hypothetical protein [Halomicrobium salinisoli]|uniref:hypothetical protein n=1 Tax=Halomicrobium salinisoli TaxID=2878391 RepID=UPI001CF02476|nr:hypothetical protein [Halomicrobium salinisoli]